jgi:periplasmic copper chaperone A
MKSPHENAPQRALRVSAGTPKRQILIAALVGAFVLVLAGPAWAHVSVTSPNAKAGEEAVLTFSVPTESETASTTKVAVQLPPFASVSVLPKAGWQIATHTTTLAKPLVTDDGDKVTKAVTEVEWTASSKASAIAPGQFDQFTVEAGPLPDAHSLAFGVVQTYSDKTVVRWNQVSAPGSDAAPDHPKAVLTLGAHDPAQPASAKPASTTGPTVLAIVALVVAAAALGFAVVSRARRQEGSSS